MDSMTLALYIGSFLMGVLLGYSLGHYVFYLRWVRKLYGIRKEEE